MWHRLHNRLNPFTQIISFFYLMIIFCPKDRSPGQLICPRYGVSLFVLGWKRLKNAVHPPEDFFLEQHL